MTDDSIENPEPDVQKAFEEFVKRVYAHGGTAFPTPIQGPLGSHQFLGMDLFTFYTAFALTGFIMQNRERRPDVEVAARAKNMARIMLAVLNAEDTTGVE